jgi:dihydroorotate dehydrogenase
MLYRLLRPLLFQLNPEAAHALSLRLARCAGGLAPLLRLLFARPAPQLMTRAFGLEFANPIGLAAGYDKDGLAPDALLALGFGHVELGTVTRGAQPGNAAPRLFRIPEARAVINSLGFPNAGVAALEGRLLTLRNRPHRRGVVGINIGKSKETPLAEAGRDYAALLPIAVALGDYVTLNVSSPNTQRLRELQHGHALDLLLGEVARAREQGPRVPVLVKIAPDMSEDEVNTLVDAVIAHGFDGIIATNTTSSRVGVDAKYASLAGGLSGAPLREKSLRSVAVVARRARGRVCVVAAGGIDSTAAVRDALAAGAELVQMYTALIYEGPGLAGRICKELTRFCQAEGCASLTELRARLGN